MTKGKYAARSQLRREDQSVRADLNSYEHHVRRLTREAADLRRKLSDQEAAFRREIRQLRAERDEGLSPEVKALRDELHRRQEADQKRAAKAKHVMELHNYQLHRLLLLLVNGLGLTRVEGWEVLLSLSGARQDEEVPAFLADPEFGVSRQGVSREDARAISAARGQRHATDVVKILHSHIRALSQEPGPG